jgi:hypothetical protein
MKWGKMGVVMRTPKLGPGYRHRPKGDIVNGPKIRQTMRVREKTELLAAWKQAVSKRFDRLVEAQLTAAEGVTHMQARDAQGKWQTVVDADVMNAKLEAGEQAYRLSAIAPSAPILKDIMDRLFGQARQSLDLDVTSTPTASLSDAELKASMAALLKKLHD